MEIGSTKKAVTINLTDGIQKNTHHLHYPLNLIVLLISVFFVGPASAQNQKAQGLPENITDVKYSVASSLGKLKQINAGLLNVGYTEAGPADGPVVLLLHGWPYDIHSYEEVVPLLTAEGYRVITPFLRGSGSTSFLSDKTQRTGQQAATASDIISLMDALNIQKAIIGGFDWGARTAVAMAALWPERLNGLVSVSGYLLVNLEANKKPLPPAAEYGWWYQYYFSTERGKIGYEQNTYEFNKQIWKLASPQWKFDTTTYDQTARSFNNKDHVAIVIHNYRWRLSLSPGDKRYDALEKRLEARPDIKVPAITIGSDFDGSNIDGKTYADKFVNKYEHRILKGIGHNVPQEDPKAFAQAILDVAKWK
ncbi:pimeloyl-ACP methyl ester carboxylesterase [Flavobacterium lindanitolerans]|uniref:Pimeloyl-ACP methyl ester carboxylesterase n=1 Tax=Flavobacterium lindanitolerans TaxID=428988 RepID=A0A497UEY7_9FLAO|nr:pimeloyl-ACP methyl ester carboxylesterase [Flavobacterium lindanitolerans]RLJ24659.1 pimeloyl-ACP methyl ester carboxylesterase [Flavobacterium lindanitolerans]